MQERLPLSRTKDLPQMLLYRRKAYEKSDTLIRVRPQLQLLFKVLAAPAE